MMCRLVLAVFVLASSMTQIKCNITTLQQKVTPVNHSVAFSHAPTKQLALPFDTTTVKNSMHSTNAMEIKANTQFSNFEIQNENPKDSIAGGTPTTYGNYTDAPSGNETSSDENYALWIFDRCQLVATCFGFVSNILTLISLAVNFKGFNPILIILLRHQSIVDAMVCLLAGIVVVQPFMWLSGLHYLDVLICYAWHGQAFYWYCVALSTYNLVIISIERYLAVAWPFLHAQARNISRRKIILYFALFYFTTLVVIHGNFIQTKLHNGTCTLEYAFEGPIIETYFFVFVIFTYVGTYLIPVLIMVTMYSIVVYKLQKRNKDDVLGHSRLVDRASRQNTKTAITVTAVFIISMGYDLHYYLLGGTGVTEYRLNSPLQKIGVFLSNLNSCANPLVYACLMPSFRLSLIKTFSCRRRRAEESSESNASISHDQSGTVL